MIPLLTVLGLQRSYGIRRVLDGVSFTIHRGDRVGIVGVNGSGKSTLMRVVVRAGNTVDPDDQPDAGEIRRARGLSLAYVPQEPRLPDGATVEEVLRAGLAAHAATVERLAAIEAGLSQDPTDDGLEEQAALHARLERLGGWDLSHELAAIHHDFRLPPLGADVRGLSGGERRRVAIAQALLGRPDLLALDEPTNHLDLPAIDWLERWLAGRLDAVLLVTHDRTFLDRVATRILELDRGLVHAYDGNYSRFLEKQAERLAVEATQEEKRASFVRRELDWIRRGPAARTTKQQARIDRFEQAVAARPEQAAPGSAAPTLVIPPGPRLGKTILETRKLRCTVGGRVLVRDLDLKLKAGDRIGIVGPNGVGKSTLLATLMGLRPPDGGQVEVGVNTRFTWLDQARSLLDDERTVLEEVAGDNAWVTVGEDTIHVRSFLRQLLFDDRTADVRVGRLSGGERNRVLLARMLRTGGNVLVLDEPTNDLDLQTLAVLEEALVAFPGCLLVASHDRWFLDEVATSILAFEEDGRLVRYEGGYGDWERRRPVRVREAEAQVTPQATPVALAKRRLSFQEKRELAELEAAIAGHEAQVARLERLLADPETYARLSGAEVGEQAKKLAAEQASLERAMERWVALSP
jgi:ATP-binding cassette subfamily F protein uup